MPNLIINIQETSRKFSDMDHNSYAIASRENYDEAVVYREGPDTYIVFFRDCSIGFRTAEQLKFGGFRLRREIDLDSIEFREKK